MVHDFERFADEWLRAWNAHDLDAIVAHYADDVEFWSPFIQKLLGDPAGVVRGRTALAAYFARGLERYPDLRFERIAVLTGVDSGTIVYRSVANLVAAEVFELDAAGRARRVMCHYAPA